MRIVGRTHDWPLVFFTVLTQAAAGALLVRLCVLILTQDEIPRAGIDALIDPVLPVALVLLVIGAGIGSLHLGRVAPARFALANWRSSPLSREVALGSLLGATVAAHFLLVRLDVGSRHLRDGLAFAGVLLGLALLRLIPRIYRLRTVPAWDTAATAAAFQLTALVVGPVLVAATLVFVAGRTGATSELVDRVLLWLGLSTVVAVGLQALGTALHLRGLIRRGGVAAESAAIVLGRYRFRLVLRFATALLGTALLLVFAWWGRASEHGVVITAAAALLLLSELLGRFLFYASHRRVGL